MKNIIIKPILTEKSNMLAENALLNQFTFQVAKNANKIEIKKIYDGRIEELERQLAKTGTQLSTVQYDNLQKHDEITRVKKQLSTLQNTHSKQEKELKKIQNENEQFRIKSIKLEGELMEAQKNHNVASNNTRSEAMQALQVANQTAHSLFKLWNSI